MREGDADMRKPYEAPSATLYRFEDRCFIILSSDPEEDRWTNRY